MTQQNQRHGNNLQGWARILKTIFKISSYAQNKFLVPGKHPNDIQQNLQSQVGDIEL